MADSQSKSAAKNKKRKEKKAKETGASASGTDSNDPHSPENLLPLLKEQRENAKAEKNFVLANKLRDQIWVLTDLIAGVKTDLPEKDLLEIINSIPSLSNLNKEEPPAEQPPPKSVVSAYGASDKEIRKLQKKLDQIENVKEKQRKGEKIEANQLEKLKKEDEIRQEIKELQEIMTGALKF